MLLALFLACKDAMTSEEAIPQPVKVTEPTHYGLAPGQTDYADQVKPFVFSYTDGETDNQDYQNKALQQTAYRFAVGP